MALCRSIGLLDVEEFVTFHLPQPPLPILEVGCGDGELAHALAKLGYAVTAIDPEAPDGPIFRRASLEEFSTEQRFDAVIASRSLHHVSDLTEGLRKIHSLLNQGALLILNEFAWDQMDEKTARWYLSHVSTPGPKHESLFPENFPDAWVTEHAGLHDANTMRQVLRDLFQERVFQQVPYIAQFYLERRDLIDEERKLIRSNEINPLGFHYVGVRR